VDYAFLQRMLIDAPSYDYDKDEDVKKASKKGKSFNYSELSQESFLSQLEQYK
jgi:hypothetical protein